MTLYLQRISGNPIGAPANWGWIVRDPEERRRESEPEVAAREYGLGPIRVYPD